MSERSPRTSTRRSNLRRYCRTPEPPMETTKGAVCATVDVGLDVPPAPFETSPPPHAAARKPATDHAAPKRNIDMILAAHDGLRCWGGECSAPLRKRSLKPTNKK